jgi:hypothetical protein
MNRAPEATGRFASSDRDRHDAPFVPGPLDRGRSKNH